MHRVPNNIIVVVQALLSGHSDCSAIYVFISRELLAPQISTTTVTCK